MTDSMRLGNDLKDCAFGGLIIGADDITLDLNGHVISGSKVFVGDGAGIDTNGHSGVTVTGGTVENFDVGIAISGLGTAAPLEAGAAGGRNKILGMKIIDNVGARGLGTGLGPGFRNPADNRETRPLLIITRNRGLGDGVLILGSSNNEIKHSTFSGNGPISSLGVLGYKAAAVPGILSISESNEILGNAIVNHTATTPLPSGPSTGIRLEQGAIGTKVERNIVKGQGLDGVSIAASEDAAGVEVMRGNPGGAPSATALAGDDFMTAADTVIRDNTISGNGSHGQPSQFRVGDGIRVARDGPITVEGNLVCGNSGHGIFVDGLLSVVSGNDVGAGIPGCERNELSDLHDAGMTDPSPPAPAGCGTNVWRGNYTKEDEVNHVCTTMGSDADLAVEIADSPDPQLIGQEIAYEATVRNLGPRKAHLVRLKVNLGEGLSFVSSEGPEKKCDYAPPDVFCDLEAIEPGDARLVVIRAMASNTGQVSARFEVDSSAPDSKSEDNAGVAVTTVTAETPSLAIGDAAVIEGNEGTSRAGFIVNLSEPLGTAVSLKYRTVEATATAGIDYAGVQGETIDFAPGETRKQVTVYVNRDRQAEPEETFFVELFQAEGAQLSRPRALGVILDDDTPLSVRDVSVPEGDSGRRKARFVASLQRRAAVPVSVDYAAVRRTADSPVDFESASGSVELRPGEGERAFTVDINGDLDPEPDEEFLIELSNAKNAALATPHAKGLIRNDDTPEVFVSRAAVHEGNEENVELLMHRAIFGISLSKAISQPVNVHYATGDPPPEMRGPSVTVATAGRDYKQKRGTIRFEPGQTRVDEPVVVVGDAEKEYSETFVLSLLGAENGTIAGEPGIGTIVDDDGWADPASLPTTASMRRSCGGIVVSGHDSDASAARENPFVIRGQYSVRNPEGARNILRRSVSYVTRGHPNPRLLYVTGLPRLDGFGEPVRVGGIMGMRRTFGQFDVASADVAAETPGFRSARTVDFNQYDAVVVASADYGGGLNQEDLDILNARKSDLSRFVAAGGGIVALQELGQSGLPGRPLRGAFEFVSLAHPAVAEPTDRMEVELRVTETGRSMGLTDPDVNGNLYYQWFPEPSGWEVMDINTRSVNLETARASGFRPENTGGLPVTLATRNPVRCRLQAETVRLPEGDAGSRTFDFNVNLVGPEPQPVTVAYSTSNGSATAGQDYNASDGSFTFAPGETSKKVSIQVNGDKVVEQDETFSLRLAFAIGSETAEIHAGGTILNDDGLPQRPGDAKAEDLLRGETAALTARQDQLPGQEPGAGAPRQQNASSTSLPSQITLGQPNPQIQLQAQPQPQPQIQAQAQQQIQAQAQSQIQAAAAPMMEAASQAEVRVEQVRDSDGREKREGRPRNDGYRAAARSPNPRAIASFSGWLVGLMGVAVGLCWTGRTSRPCAVRIQPARQGTGGSPGTSNNRRRRRA